MLDTVYRNLYYAADLIDKNKFNKKEALQSFLNSDYDEWLKYEIPGKLCANIFILANIFTQNCSKSPDDKIYLPGVFPAIVTTYAMLAKYYNKSLKEIASLFDFDDLLQYGREIRVGAYNKLFEVCKERGLNFN